MHYQKDLQKKSARLAVIIVAACMGLAGLKNANAFGPLVHTLIAYKAQDETKSAFKKWSLGFGNRQVFASMAGALLHDVGYVDPKLELLSNLLHYEATGAYVDRFLGKAVAGQRWDEVGFGLGLALHYAGDSEGHYWATNRVVARLTGDKTATGTLAYEDNRDAHTCVERWFDVIAVADRKLLPENELVQFILILDGLAGFIEEKEREEPGLFSIVTGPLSTAIRIAYGTSLPVMVVAGNSEAAYAALLHAYRQMLNEMAVSLRVAEELYGLKVDYTKLRYWPKLGKAGITQFFKRCGPKQKQVEEIVKDKNVLKDAIDKSVTLYANYLAGVERRPKSAGGGNMIWAQGKAPPDVNLDTNLISAEGEYWLADVALKELVKRGGKAVSTEYVKLGQQRSAVYFGPIDPSRIETQVRMLDSMERNANGITAPGRESPMPLPAQSPEFRVGDMQQKCAGAPITRLSPKMAIRVTATRVCLPKDSRVIDAWIGALAAAEKAATVKAGNPADFGLLYRSTCYAYYPRTGSSKPEDVARCMR